MESQAVAVSGRAPAVVRALFDLSRSRQALLSVAQPALGAVLAAGGLPNARQMALGLLAASTGFLAVFSVNDVLDYRSDTLALGLGKAEMDGFDLDTVYVRHPIARGDISLAAALVWVASLAAVSAVTAYALSPVCVALFAAAVALEFAYCALRSVTWAKTFVSGAMVGVGGLAGWAAVAPLTMRALPLFAFLALWEIAGRNLPNDLADIAADRRTGITTVATVFGERAAAKAVVAGAAATLAALVLAAGPGVGALASVAAAAWAMGAPALALVRQPAPLQAASYFNRASVLPALVLVAVLVLPGPLG